MEDSLRDGVHLDIDIDGKALRGVLNETYIPSL